MLLASIIVSISLAQIYVTGYDTRGADVPEKAPYDFWFDFTPKAAIDAGGVFVVCHEGADVRIRRDCDMPVKVLSDGDDGICLVKGTQTKYEIIDCVGDWKEQDTRDASDLRSSGSTKQLISEAGVTCTQVSSSGLCLGLNLSNDTLRLIARPRSSLGRRLYQTQ